jgi:hypothetical protein
MATNIDAYTTSDNDTPTKHNKLVEQIRKWIFDPLKTFNVKELKTDVLSPADLLITTGTGKTILLGTPVYNDIQYVVTDGRVSAVNAPTWATFNTNMSEYRFAVNDFIDLGSNELPHDYKEGTNVEVHIHWVTNSIDGTNRGVKWEIIYCVSNMDGTAPFTQAFQPTVSISAETTIPAGTNVLSHIYTSIGVITGTNFKIGAQLKLRLRRIAATGTAPSLDPFALQVGVHYETDTMGSRTVGGK